MNTMPGVSAVCGILLLSTVAANTENCDCSQLTGEKKDACLAREALYCSEADRRLREARNLVLHTDTPPDAGTSSD